MTAGSRRIELLATERPVFAHDQIDLPPCVGVDHVAHVASANRLDGIVHVVPRPVEGGNEATDRLERRVDDHVDITGHSRLTVVGARHRTRQHVRNLGAVEKGDDRAQELELHRATRSAISSPCRSRNHSTDTSAFDHSGCRARIPATAIAFASSAISTAQATRSAPLIDAKMPDSRRRTCGGVSVTLMRQL